MGAKSVPADPHKRVNTVEKQWEEASVDLWEGEEEEAAWESLFPTAPLSPACGGAVVTQPSPENVWTRCTDTLLCPGLVGDARFRVFFLKFFSFFHLDPFTFSIAKQRTQSLRAVTIWGKVCTQAVLSLLSPSCLKLFHFCYKLHLKLPLNLGGASLESIFLIAATGVEFPLGIQGVGSVVCSFLLGFLLTGANV